MAAFITWFGSICSIIGVGISLVGKSDTVKFQSYKRKGRDMKEAKQLGKAMLWYKKALDHSETRDYSPYNNPSLFLPCPLIGSLFRMPSDYLVSLSISY